MGIQKLIRKTLKGEIEKSIAVKIAIGLIAGIACIGGIAYAIYHNNEQNNAQTLEQNDIESINKYQDYQLVYDDSFFMNNNDIMSEETRAENATFLNDIKEKIDEREMDEESVNQLNTLNADLTELSEENRKNMLDEFHQLIQSYNISVINDSGETSQETLYALKDDEITDGLTVTNIQIPENQIDEIKSMIDDIITDIEAKYYKDCNEVLINLALKLSSFSGDSNDVVKQIIDQYENTTNADINSKEILTPEMSQSSGNKTDSNSAATNPVNANNDKTTSASSPVINSVPGNNHGNNTDKKEIPVTNPVDQQSQQQQKPAPNPTPEKEEFKDKYTWDDSVKVNEILNQWFDCEITEQEAENRLKEAFPSLNMKLMHYGKGQEDAANAFWNSIDSSYLKSNILTSDNYGSYFIFGK